MNDILDLNTINLFIKDILIFENNDGLKMNILPFFADGYPGIVFHQSEHGAFLTPKNKELSNFFMYGQTVDPIEILIEGSYRLIIFQIYPFAAKALFDSSLKELKDDCYNLELPGDQAFEAMMEALFGATKTSKQVEIISYYLYSIVKEKGNLINEKIRAAFNLIIESKGKMPIKSVAEKVYITERTLQRGFLQYIGISPKKFAKIIQFQLTIKQISNKTLPKFTQLGLENGYADQPHFIRNFKRFTGKTPSRFKESNV